MLCEAISRALSGNWGCQGACGAGLFSWRSRKHHNMETPQHAPVRRPHPLCMSVLRTARRVPFHAAVVCCASHHNGKHAAVSMCRHVCCCQKPCGPLLLLVIPPHRLAVCAVKCLLRHRACSEARPADGGGGPDSGPGPNALSMYGIESGTACCLVPPNCLGGLVFLLCSFLAWSSPFATG